MKISILDTKTGEISEFENMQKLKEQFSFTDEDIAALESCKMRKRIRIRRIDGKPIYPNRLGGPHRNNKAIYISTPSGNRYFESHKEAIQELGMTPHFFNRIMRGENIKGCFLIDPDEE